VHRRADCYAAGVHQAVTSGPDPQLFERRANGPRSERFSGQVDGAQVELRVVKEPFALDAAGFVQKTETLAQLNHPSLRMVRGATLLPDGRPAAVMSLVDWVPLSACPRQATMPMLVMSIELAEGLAALHAAGLVMGVLDADDIYPGSPAVLDASLAGLSQSGDTPTEDVKMLALALLGAIGGGKEAAPLEAIFKTARTEGMTADALVKELVAVRTRWHARTVSGNFAIQVPPAEVEVVEPDLTGRTLSHWRIDGVLGEGAMARVYKATDTRTSDVVAMKVLKQEHVTDPELVGRFIQEVKAVEAIHNPHIVTVTDFGDEQVGPGQRLVYCVMEMLEGQPLSDAMNEPFAVTRSVNIALQTAKCLQTAHQVGVVHRDIKPENLFLTTRDGAEFVKLLDFGIAKLLRPIGDLQRVGTKAGVVVGTPEYMAPEQALGGEADQRMDVYAVGLVLYELLAGQQPFQGDTFGKLVVEITQSPPPPLPAMTRVGERLPPGLSAVVLKCLEKRPDDRYQSAQALSEALEPFAHSRRTGEIPKVVAPARINEDVESMSVPSEAELEAVVKTSRVPLVIAIAVVVALLGGVGYVFGPWNEPPPAPPQKTAEPVAPPSEAMPAEVAKVDPPMPPVEVVKKEVELRITSTPAGATVKQGDDVLGVTPLARKMPRDAAPVTLQFELAGYAPALREVTLNADTEFAVKLVKAKKTVKEGRAK